MTIHSTRFAQISPELVQLAALQWNKTSIKIPIKYDDHIDVFYPDLIMELSDYMSMIKHIIKWIERKESLYRFIYAFGPVEWETPNVHIETHLKTEFIWSIKFSASIIISFDRKSNGSHCLYIDFWDLNNLTIKNQYLFLLMKKSLNQLNWAKRFIRLNLTNT